MTRAELTAFWDGQLARWLQGKALSPRLNKWRAAYAAPIQEWAFPEPYIGNLLGALRIVLLANNPGIAYPELQACDGAFAARIRELGFTAWAATRPFEGPDSPWVQLRGEIAHNWDRIRFARRFLADESFSRFDLLNLELFPWHSPRLEGSIRIDPVTLREFVLEPLSEFGPEVPVVALGVAWARAFDRVPEVVTGRDEFAGFSVPSRRARLYATDTGARVLVVWHSGSDKPPNPDDTVRLREIWSGSSGTPWPLSLAARVRSNGLNRGGVRRRAVSGAASSAGDDAGALSAELVAWVGEEFSGSVGTGTDPRRPRLHVGGSAAHLGWDVRGDHLAVWVRRLRESDQQLLSEQLSNPSSVHQRKNDWAFDVYTGDAVAFREVIRQHVLAGAV